MAYMSYCRFEGTRFEMDICINEVYDHVNEEAPYTVSDGEINHFKGMVHDFVELLQDTEILNEEGEIDEEKLDEVCEKMKKSYDGEEW